MPALDTLDTEDTDQLARQKGVERRRQVRGLLLLALVVLAFSLLRAGLHHVFTPSGWWRLW